VLHAQKSAPGSSREPLQFGAEVFGHAGPESDLEVQELALEVLADAGASRLGIDLADARILKGLLDDTRADSSVVREVVQALSRKDAASLGPLLQAFPTHTRKGLLSLLDLFGDREVLQRARQLLPQHPLIAAALDQLEWLACRLEADHPELRVSFDLADMGGYAYYSGVRFAVYVDGSAEALARGGRYDEVGAIFGRNRPAVGFSLDLKSVAALTEPPSVGQAVRAPWADDAALKSAVRRLREAGETVVFEFPGMAAQESGRPFDRELVKIAGQWVMRPL
jgi:ATP phosphoribosyltransferase regulatory subunit